MKKSLMATALAASTLLLGCDPSSGSASKKNEQPATGNASYHSLDEVDATSHAHWVYLNLANKTVVTANEEWHMAVRRYKAMVNPEWRAGIADDQSEFYDAQGNAIQSAFVNYDPNAPESLAALTKTYAEQEVQWVDSALVRTINSDWYLYDPVSHQVSANAKAVYGVRHSDGSQYSQFSVSQIQASRTALTATLQYQQWSDQGWLEAKTAQLTTGECLDLETASLVSCDQPQWDLTLIYDGRTPVLTTNGGESGPGKGGAYGPVPEALLPTLSAQILKHSVNADFYSSVFSEFPAFEYGAVSPHKMAPNGRTYVLEKEGTQFNVQLIQYYKGDDSGYLTLRVK